MGPPHHLPLPCTIDAKYELLSFLGSGQTGQTGSVYVARDLLTSRLVALRLIPRGTTTTALQQDQLVSHYSVSRHPHVIALKETFLTADYLCVAMEYATGGNLLAHIQASHGRLPESTSRRFFQQLLLCVDFCHRKAIQLQEIKLESILLQPALSSPDNLILKLCDFGTTPSQSPQHPDTRVITLVYAAPEVIQALEYDRHQADIWSCGVILYTMLAGTYPFHTPPGPYMEAYLIQMLHAMAARDVRLPSHVLASPLCHDLIFRMLDPNPTTRITLQQVMSHPWFTVDLPPSFSGYNDQLLHSEPAEMEAAVESIKKAVEEAATTASKSAVVRPVACPPARPSAAPAAVTTPKAAA